MSSFEVDAVTSQTTREQEQSSRRSPADPDQSTTQSNDAIAMTCNVM